MSNNSRILLIDDDRAILAGLSVRLKASGFGVVSTSDARNAVNVADGSDPDIIVMDVCMPGMDGLDLLSQLKSDPHTSSIPVIMLSANVAGETRTKARDLGASFFLGKPFDADKLLSAIHFEIEKQKDLKSKKLN